MTIYFIPTKTTKAINTNAEEIITRATGKKCGICNSDFESKIPITRWKLSEANDNETKIQFAGGTVKKGQSILSHADNKHKQLIVNAISKEADNSPVTVTSESGYALAAMYERKSYRWGELANSLENKTK